jgi:hypothetical protein
MPPLSSYNRFAYLEVDTLIESHTCIAKSTEVMQTPSHPPNPNRCSFLPAWEHWLPIKYIIAASPGPMSLLVDVEIKSTDTVVKQCTLTGCFIDIEWAKLNNIPTHPLCKGTSVRFLTSPILSHSPPVHMYSLSSPLYHFQGPYL